MKRIEKLPLKSSVILGIPLIIAACSSARDDGGGVPPSTGPEPGTTQPGPQPEFGQLVQQKEAPPPISGGTLAVSKTNGVAVAADSDRDRVYVVDLPNRSVKHNIELPHRSEPGRVALDGSNQAHVALRNTGELVTINLDTGVTTTRKACGAPRGVTFDATANQIYVACATGDLVIFPTDATKGEVSRLPFGRDLRDVITSGKTVYMTRFRTAQLVPVTNLQSGKQGPSQSLGGNLAWRAVAAPPADPGGAGEQQETPAVVAQDPSPEPVRPEPGGYGQTGSGLGTSCGDVGIVSTRLFLLGDQGGSVRLPSAVLPVDLATNGREFVVVAAGNSHTKQLPQLFVVHRDQLRGTQECVTTVQGNVPGQAISAGFDDKDQLIVQTREPAALHIMSDDRRRPWKTIVLSNESKEDTGHAIFHANAGGNLACASCHAEGMDDGKTWEFVGMGPRRTPSLLGTTPGTEPFHWSGDMKDLNTLVDHVFVERMSGPKIAKEQVDTLGHFIFTLPPPVKLRTAADVPARGKELFVQRCATCHTGEILTNNKTVDVGTGGEFQVPSLVGLAWRGPFLHTGCASTLIERFDPACGGDKHGDTKDLTKDQLEDMVMYLESL